MDTGMLYAIALKTALLLACAGGTALLLAKKSAASRHALWTGALVLGLLMPLAVLGLPSLDVIPSTWKLSELIASALPGPGSTAPIDTGAGQGASTIAFQVWSAGALLLLVRNLFGHAGLILWRRRARPLRSGRWAATIERVIAEVPYDKPLRVLESPRAANPCTWGIFRPVLLVPEDSEAWTESGRRQALLHEIAHVRRRDCLTACIARLACAIHWYNPLVWIAARQVRRLQEQACDDEVLRFGTRPSEYAQFLVDAAAGARGAPRLAHAALGVIRHSELHDRVASILDPDRKRHSRSRPVAAALITMSCLTLFVAAAVPQEIEPSPISRGAKPPVPEWPAPPDPPPAPPPLPGIEPPTAPEAVPDLAAPETVPPVPPVPPVAPVPPTPPAETTPPTEARPSELLRPAGP